MQWISVELKRRSPFSDISSDYPGSLVASWSNGKHDVVQFFCRDPITLSHVKRDLQKLEKEGVITLLSSITSYHDLLVTQIRYKDTESRSASTEKIITHHNGLVSFPVTFQNGSEFYRIIALIDDDVSKMLEAIGKQGKLRIIQRLKIGEIPVEQSLMFSTSDLFSKITDKQATALLSAAELGYFRVPRRTKFDDMARHSGVPRTTFETHVRKAENKIIEAISPYLSVRFGTQERLPSIFHEASSDGQMTAKQFYKAKFSTRREHVSMISEFFKAIKQGENEKVEQMVRRNSALLQEKDDSGLSAVAVATYYGRPNIARFLVSEGANLDVFEASMVGEMPALRKLIQKDKKLALSFSSDGFTPLHLAAFFGNLEVAKCLIDNGADVNAVAKNLMKVTPLHSATARNQTQIAALLIDSGADVNAKQENSYTPLHAAAQNGNSPLAQLLLKHGAKIDAKTDDGKTPLDMTRVDAPESGSKKSREKLEKILERESRRTR